MIEQNIFRTIVKNTPLVSVDLLIFDPEGRVLLGLRNNEPAKGTWFVPGSRINKGEKFDEAFLRITKMETGSTIKLEQALFKGVYQHIYDTNALDEPGYGSHYIVLAFAIKLDKEIHNLPDEQHSQYLWLTPGELLKHPNVHSYTQAYFNEQQQTLVVPAT